MVEVLLLPISFQLLHLSLNFFQFLDTLISLSFAFDTNTPLISKDYKKWQTLYIATY